jgi:hypothetical protein
MKHVTRISAVAIGRIRLKKLSLLPAAGNRLGRTTDQQVGLLRQHGPQRRVISGCAGDKMLQLVLAAQSKAGRHRLQALALTRSE